MCIFQINYTWACDHLKTGNLSADNFQKILDLNGSTPEPAIRSNDTSPRTAVNWSQHWCSKCVHYQFSCAPQLARKYELEHWSPVVRTDGRCTVTWLPNFLGWVDFLDVVILLSKWRRSTLAIFDLSALLWTGKNNFRNFNSKFTWLCLGYF